MFIPEEVKLVIEKLNKAGFKAFIVGGCVRDTLRGVKPSDWDIATSAKPQEIGKIFLKSFANNRFGTVTVLTDSEDETLKEIEITPFRTEEKYTDKRHPDKIEWAKTIEEDLTRRDFTINAMALEISDLKSQKSKIIDLFNGQKDLKNRVIRAVGKPEDRFSEDALRMMRAPRFATTLGFKIEEETAQAIKKNSPWLKMISKERIRDELMKIIMSDRAAEGIELLRRLKLLRIINPEIEEGYKETQKNHDIYELYEHLNLSLKYADNNN